MVRVATPHARQAYKAYRLGKAGGTQAGGKVPLRSLLFRYIAIREGKPADQATGSVPFKALVIRCSSESIGKAPGLPHESGSGPFSLLSPSCLQEHDLSTSISRTPGSCG